jgi:hypothetical protein
MKSACIDHWVTLCKALLVFAAAAVQQASLAISARVHQWYSTDKALLVSAAAAAAVCGCCRCSAVGVIGDICSRASVAAAGVANMRKIPVISPASTSPSLSETDFFFRTVRYDMFRPMFYDVSHLSLASAL